MAVKKKAVAKKAAPKKSSAKKTTAKKVAKKSVAKKSTAKKTTAKKVAKKSAPKKVAKKSAPKKVAKKAVAKKAVAKKAVAKKTVKKSPARKSATSSVVIPPVPTGASRDRVNVSTTPAKPAATATPAVKPSAAPRQGSSKGVLVAVLLGVAILTAIVASQQSKHDSTLPVDNLSPAATESASPEATATESASPAASTDTTNAATTGEAPSKFIGNWKDASTKEIMVLTWKAPAGDVTGYKVEIAPNGGAYKEVSQIPATQLSFELTKSSDSQYTSFRVSAIYADGTLGVAKAFGFAGQYE